MLRTSRLGGPLQRCHSCLPFPPITINTTPTTRSHHHHHHHHQMRRRRRGYDEIFSYRLNQRNRMSYPNLLVWRLVHSTHSIGSIVAGSVGNSGNNGIPTHTETFAAAMRTKTTQSRSLTYLGASIAALTSFLALYMTHHYLEGTEGVQRAVSFYSLAIPKYIVYRYHQLVQSPDHVWERLDQETSQQGLDIILRLKGFYIKCGQMCASNIGNAFPVVWQETMSILQDQVPPEDFQTVILPIIQSELPNYQQIFSYIDPIPIGSASIGQVHRAKMIIHHNSNNNQETKDVVIKICYPHVERLLRGDVRTIRSFCEIAQPVHVPAMREVEKAFSTEFDYVQEANNLYEVRSNLIRAGLCQSTSPDDSDNSIVHPTAICTVPYPYRQYCTKRVLVMEEIHGDKLVDVLKRDGPRWMEWATRVESMKRSKSITASTTTTATPISGSDNDIRRSSSLSSSSSKPNQRITTEEYERYLSIMDTSRRIQNATNRIYNSTIGWVKGIQLPYQLASELPLNPSKLVDDLMLIHGHQVLVDGRFNADCHPGNFLLCRTKDGSPRLGLIDFGQVKTLTKEQRHLFCKIIIALANENKDAVVALMTEAGFRSKRMDPNIIYLYAKVCYDEDNKELTNGKHIQLFMEDIQNMDPIIQLPTDYIMVGRASILLRGLAHMLQQSRSVAKSWKPLAERVLQEDL